MSNKQPILPKIISLSSSGSPTPTVPLSIPESPVRPSYRMSIVPPVSPIPIAMPSSPSRPLTPITIPAAMSSIPSIPISSPSISIVPTIPVSRDISPKVTLMPDIKQIKLDYNYTNDNLFSPQYKVISKIIKKNERGILEYYMTKLVLLNGRVIYLAMDVEEKIIFNDVNVWKINNTNKLPNSLKNYLMSNIRNQYGYVVEHENNLHVLYYDNKVKATQEETISGNTYYTSTPQIYPLYLMSDFRNRLDYIYKNVDESYKIINDYILAFTNTIYKNAEENISSIDLQNLKMKHTATLMKYREIIIKLVSFRENEANPDIKTKYAYNLYLKDEKLRELYDLNNSINKISSELNTISTKVNGLSETIDLMKSKAPIIDM